MDPKQTQNTVQTNVVYLNIMRQYLLWFTGKLSPNWPRLIVRLLPFYLALQFLSLLFCY